LTLTVLFSPSPTLPTDRDSRGHGTTGGRATAGGGGGGARGGSGSGSHSASDCFGTDGDGGGDNCGDGDGDGDDLWAAEALRREAAEGSRPPVLCLGRATVPLNRAVMQVRRVGGWLVFDDDDDTMTLCCSFV
jgi:hypothetical protein